MPDAQDSRGYRPIGEEGDDTRWMTYAELGQARGINTASAKRLASRRKWRRQPGNDGTARVAVPVDEAMRRSDNARDARGDVARLVSDLEAALSTLQEQLERERSRADQATEAAERNAERLIEAEFDISRLRAAAETAALLRDALETALTAEERSRESSKPKPHRSGRPKWRPRPRPMCCGRRNRPGATSVAWQGCRRLGGANSGSGSPPDGGRMSELALSSPGEGVSAPRR